MGDKTAKIPSNKAMPSVEGGKGVIRRRNMFRKIEEGIH